MCSTRRLQQRDPNRERERERLLYDREDGCPHFGISLSKLSLHEEESSGLYRVYKSIHPTHLSHGSAVAESAISSFVESFEWSSATTSKSSRLRRIFHRAPSVREGLVYMHRIRVPLDAGGELATVLTGFLESACVLCHGRFQSARRDHHTSGALLRVSL